MSRLESGALPSFCMRMRTVYLSPGFGELGSTSKLSRPGRSACTVACLAATPAESSKPAGTEPPVCSPLLASVLPVANERPAGRTSLMPPDPAPAAALVLQIGRAHV